MRDNPEGGELEGCDSGSEIGTVHSERDRDGSILPGNIPSLIFGENLSIC